MPARASDAATSRRSRSRSTSRARTAACRSTSSRRATSRSTRRTARASAATASARASRSTPSSSSPNDDLVARATARSRRGRGSAATTSSGCSSRSPTEYGFSIDTPWKKLKKNDKKAVLYGTGEHVGEGVVPQPLRPAALVHHAVRGCGPVARAPPHRVRERPRPRADRGLHARGAVPRVRWRAPAAGVARGHDRRHEHLRGRRAVDPQGVGVPRLARARPSATA